MANPNSSKNIYQKVAAFLFGVFFFFFTVDRFGGFGVVWQQLQKLGWFYLLVLFNSFLWMIGYSISWNQVLPRVKKYQFFKVLKAKMAGAAVNSMTPLGFLGGDSVRLMMINKFVDKEHRLRSVVLDRLIHSFSAQVFNFIAIFFLIYEPIDFPWWLIVIMQTTYLVLGSFMAYLFFNILVGKGLDKPHALFVYLKLEKRFPKLWKKWVGVREQLMVYQNRSAKPLLISFFFHFVGRCMGVIEIAIVFYAFEGFLSWPFLISLTALTSFFSVVFGFIPGALGVLETLYAEFFILYGLDSESGMSIQIVRRLRILFWMMMAFVLIDFKELVEFIKSIFRSESKDSLKKRV